MRFFFGKGNVFDRLLMRGQKGKCEGLILIWSLRYIEQKKNILVTR